MEHECFWGMDSGDHGLKITSLRSRVPRVGFNIGKGCYGDQLPDSLLSTS